jgi:DNA polymerase-3 subunit chi
LTGERALAERGAMEVRFYHLERQSLDKVLPRMVQMGLERGWRQVIQAGSGERAAQLSGLLWTFAEEVFIPHGGPADGFAEMQPVWLTDGEENPNGATVRFFVDGARAGDVSGLNLAVVIFDGNDESAVSLAREDWKRFRSAGCEISYWQQDDEGRWQNRAKQGSSAE